MIRYYQPFDISSIRHRPTAGITSAAWVMDLNRDFSRRLVDADDRR